jgi:hypothetical protein
MKKYFAVFLCATTFAVRAALPQLDLIARIHFAGGDAIAADKNYSAFTNEFSSAEALALRQQIADKLAPWLAGWLQTKAGANTSAANLRPLLNDLQFTEWFFEARTVAGKPSGQLAVKLNPARLPFWKVNLKSSAFEISDSRGWLFILFGDAAGKLGLVQPPPPLNSWLECDVNWLELARWYPELKQLDLPETKFSVAASEGNLHINGKFYSPQNFSTKLDSWQFPTNDVHQPMTSFTAVRGFAGWLAEQDWARAWKIAPSANQLFLWSLNGTPFQTFAAIPTTDANHSLDQLYNNFQPVIANGNSHDRFGAPFTLNRETNRISLTGMPVIAPEIRAAKDGRFLIADAFPNTPRSRPLPPELFQELAKPNLVFYHWEITAPRFPSQLQYSQLLLMLTRHKQVNGESVPFKWAQKTCATLGNSTTEIIRSAPDQMDFSRNAPGGLTAFEFIALANWLDAPNFPQCNLELPPLPEKFKKLRAKKLQSQPMPMPAPPQ